MGARYFINTEKDLGTIKQKTQHKFLFVLKKNAPLVSSIKESCSKCMTIKFNSQARSVAVIYNATKVPNYLSAQGFYETRKTITVTFVTGERQVLNFKAIVTK